MSVLVSVQGSGATTVYAGPAPATPQATEVCYVDRRPLLVGITAEGLLAYVSTRGQVLVARPNGHEVVADLMPAPFCDFR